MQLVEGKKLQTFFREPANEAIDIFCDHLLHIQDLDKLAKHAADYIKHCPCNLYEFPKIANGYSRTILYRLENGFEAMVARWSPGARTVAHGHPAFGYYHLLQGQWRVENFEKRENTIHRVSTTIWQAGECFTVKGTSERFDNGIHRINVLEESLSFHIYSDNALKGECYYDVENN